MKQTKRICKGEKDMMILLTAAFLALALLLPFRAKADDFSYRSIEKEWDYAAACDTLLLPVYEFDQQDYTNDRGVKLLRSADTADWTMETWLSDDTLGSTGGLHGGLTVYLDAKNYLIFGLNGQRKVTLYGVCGGKEIDGGSEMGESRYFRMEKKGQYYAFYYSKDGSTWETFKKSFQDVQNALQGAQIGLMNRYTNKTELFHSAELSLKCWAAEYAYFRLNGQELPFSLNGEHGWKYYKSHGVFALAVPGGGSTSLLRQQKEKDWVLDARLNYTSGSGSALVGAAVYQDADNYLMLGVRGVFANKTHYEVSGIIGGQPTGVLMSFDGKLRGNRTLRILRRTEAGQPDRYYFYVIDGNNEYGFICLGCYEDTNGIFRGGQYGLMGVEDSGEADALYTAQFEFCTETCPDGYSDYFFSNVLDGMWQSEGAKGLRVGNKSLGFGSEEGEAAYLLRAPLKKDWSLDCTVIALGVNSTAGLAMAKGENTLQYGVQKNQIVIRVNCGGRLEEQVIQATAQNLRMLKNGDTYIMQYSKDGLTWQEAGRYTDASGAFDGARCGLTVQGGSCTFRKYYEGYRPAGVIAAITGLDILYPLTGENSMNRTESRWGFGSGDLGAMFEHNGKVYMVFGDTFAHDRLQGAWINNAISIGTVDDPKDGVQYSQLHIGGTGSGLVKAGFEHTCAMIPSTGFGLGEAGSEVLYMWVHEIYSWQSGGHRDISGMGWAVSKNGGKTWAYQRLFDGDSHFQFVSCWQENGLLYLYGNIGGGYGETYLMCVEQERALERDAYRFFAGVDADGAPIWTQTEDEAAIVLDYNEREIGITYNEYLGCYLMTGWDSFNGQMVSHESPTLFGPWSDAYTLLNRQYTPTELKQDQQTSIYGAYTLPTMVEEGGKSMYFTLSEYDPYQVFWMRVDFEKRGQ